MAVEVRIPTILRKHTGGEKAVQADGDTIRDLLGDLDRRYPGIAGQLLTEDGSASWARSTPSSPTATSSRSSPR